jgi:Fe-S cluster biosynthesis and repair protein YggX
MDIQQRIAQFENMCREDPENDMAWFSLAGAYAQAGRPIDAAEAYRKCYEFNPAMSKAYQLAGEALIAAGEPREAADVLEQGYRAGAERGDLMPKNAMADLLRSLGREPPEVQKKAEAVSTGTFMCQRTGRPGTQMERAPFRGPVGEWIRQNISRETFEAWIGQGTKVINELRLDLSRDEDAEVYDRHMHEYLGIDEELLAQLRAQSTT